MKNTGMMEFVVLTAIQFLMAPGWYYVFNSQGKIEFGLALLCVLAHVLALAGITMILVDKIKQAIDGD